MTIDVKRKKLVLIDGHAIIHRAFHAIPEDLSTSGGEPVNATFGFTSTLMKAWLEERSDYIAVTFDRPCPTFRHKEYALYKAHRPVLPENMKPQFVRIREVVQAFGIPIYECDGFEADDVLGTLSVQANKAGVDTIIYTGDMDTLQLVTEHVLVKVAKRGIGDVTEYNEQEVCARYGFEPCRLPDFKGLIGDKSDNIPGVPGIGEKTASRLIAEYGDLENILAHVNELKAREQRLLRDAAEQARQSKHLATIVLNVPVRLDLEACHITTVESERIFSLFRKLEFRTLVDRAQTLFRVLGLSTVVSSDDAGMGRRLVGGEIATGGDGAGMGVRGAESLNVSQYVSQYVSPIGVVPIIQLPPVLGTDVVSSVAPTAEVVTKSVATAVAATSEGEGVHQLSLFDLPPASPVSGQSSTVFGQVSLFLDDERNATSTTNTEVITAEESLQLLVERLWAVEAFALDTETSSEEPRSAELVGISLAWVPGEAYYIPIGHTVSGEGQETERQLPLAVVLVYLKPVLESQRPAKYMHNAKYDMAILARYGVSVQGLGFDTMLGAYLTDPGRRGLGLKDQAFQRLKRIMTPISDLIGSGSKMISMVQVPISKAAAYAGADADVTLRLVEPIRADLERYQLLDLYERIEQPLLPVLMQMEAYGVALDVPFLRQFAVTLDEQLRVIEQAIYDAIGHRFNINSTKQLAEILFGELRLPTGKKTKTGYSVNAEVIESLRGKHPVVDHLLEYRQLSKLKSTYVDGLLTLMDSQTGRIYTSFNQTITSSGRLSSSNPNLQNIPVRTELGRQIRRAFIVDEGYTLLTADYSQFELRILAYITGEARLVEAFTREDDIHAMTAATLFGVGRKEVTKDQRRLAKTVVYAILYGQSAFGLSQITGMSAAEAADFIRRYHETFPAIKGYVEKTLHQAREQGYVNTLFGRKRFFPDMHALSHTERQALEREAINMPIQGSNADLIKIAMIQLHHALQERGMGTRMLLQVHDELVFEVPLTELEEASQLIRQKMEGVAELLREFFHLDIPLRVEMKMGPNFSVS
jgi:DNA polymerase-1